MRVVLTLSALVFVALCATWTYRVNYAAREAMGRVAGLGQDIAREREAIRALRTEWAYLNRPDRLQALVARHGGALGLQPLKPDQFGTVAIVAYPPPPEPLQETAVEKQK
jgi:hypothetical protein